jgi:23S rRNA (guanosine2251-2'-O)-methyltransferase
VSGQRGRRDPAAKRSGVSGRGRGGGSKSSGARQGVRSSGGRSQPGQSGQRGGSRTDEAQRGGQRHRPDHLGGDIVEGRQAVRELLRAGRRGVEEVRVADELGEAAVLAEIEDLATDLRVPYSVVSRRKIDDLALTEHHQGVIARAAPLWPVELEELLGLDGGRIPFVLALDGVTDPGNLGAILRTAEVVGATGVVLPKHRAVRLSPAAVKAAAGAVEHLRIALVGGLPAALARASDEGLWVVGLDGDSTDSVYDMRVADQALMLVVGAEGDGLSSLVRRRCDQVVSIPQFGHTESLNVAAATAVACFEVQRRRAAQS